MDELFSKSTHHSKIQRSATWFHSRKHSDNTYSCSTRPEGTRRGFQSSTMKCLGACRYGTHGIPHKEGRRSNLTRISFPVILVVVVFYDPTRNLIVNRLGLWPPDYIKEGRALWIGGGENNCTTQHFSINPTQRLRPTGRRAITQSQSRARTRINRLSLMFTVEFCIR